MATIHFKRGVKDTPAHIKALDLAVAKVEGVALATTSRPVYEGDKWKLIIVLSREDIGYEPASTIIVAFEADESREFVYQLALTGIEYQRQHVRDQIEAARAAK